MGDRLERNKKTVVTFYELIFNQCRPAEAVEKYVGDVCIQHNSSVGEGKQSVHPVLSENGKGVPGQEG